MRINDVYFLGILVPVCFILNCDCDISKDRLRSVIVMFRHGDRSPGFSFPHDKFYEKSYWPMGSYQLTNKGKLRQYNLGRWLRKKYNFLPELYSPGDVHVLSSDYDHTLMSAASNLAGLYPPKERDIWNPELQWQPIPIHTNSLDVDPVVFTFKNCPKYTQIYDQLEETKYFKDLMSQYSEISDTLANYTGWEMNKISYYAMLQSTLYIYSEHNLSFVPRWYGDYQEDIEYLAAVHYTKYTFTKKLTELCLGVFFNEIITHFDRIRNNQDAPKMRIFSAHQGNIASILYWAGVFDYKVPKFASMLMWELYEGNNGYYVNFIYKSNDTYCLKLPFRGCQLDCNYDRFKEILTPFSLDAHMRTTLCQNV